MEYLIGKTIDNYRILEVIGRGGMGVVLKAVDTNLEKVVALKMMDPFLAKNEEFVRQFKNEAKLLAKSENPNIVIVHALRETESQFFMVMEYVESEPLSKHISENGPCSFSEIMSISKQLLNAIGHAHKVRVLHRDIKPSNILLCNDGKIKITDFGLAKVIQQKGLESTVSQIRAGTLYYMSPEQVKGLKDIDERSDIYSIGMTIYEMIAGRVPFEKSDSEYTIQKKIIDGAIPSPAVPRSDIPKQLIKLVLKAINKEPSKRFQNITEMSEYLSKTEYPHSDNTTKLIPKTFAKINGSGKIKKKNKIIISSLSVLLLIVLSIAIYLLFIRGEPKVVIDPNINKNSMVNLIIKSNPAGANVIIDSISKGKTELHIDSLAIKTYLIALQLKGYEEWSSSYNFLPGDTTIAIDLKKIVVTDFARLNLKMDEEGSIFVDNSRFSVNANNLISQNLTAENHRVKFVNKNNVIKESTVVLKNGTSRNLTCYFQHLVSIGTLDENGNSIWASLFINGTKADIVTPTEITLSAGL
jgi:serine/threonine protein kinase